MSPPPPHTHTQLEAAMKMTVDASMNMRDALERVKRRSIDTGKEGEFNTKHEAWFEALARSVDAVTDGNPSLMESVSLD